MLCLRHLVLKKGEGGKFFVIKVITSNLSMCNLNGPFKRKERDMVLIQSGISLSFAVVNLANDMNLLHKIGTSVPLLPY